MIIESWRRVLATGLEPIDVLPSIEADPSETRERWLEHPLGLLRHVLVEPSSCWPRSPTAWSR